MLKERLKKLKKNQTEICNFIESYMVDEHGLVLSYLNVDTLKPWTEEEISNYDLSIYQDPARGDNAELLTYEDTLMATGEYASAMLLKYEATNDITAFAMATNQIFALLRVLFEGEYSECGYLPKPHGGLRKAKFSHQISPDQYIKVFIALRDFQRYASTSLNKTIDKYLVAMADYFANRNFCHPYRERTFVTPDTHYHMLCIIIPSLFVAYKITGNKKYKELLKNNFDNPLADILDGKCTRNFNMCSLLIEGFDAALREGYKDERLIKITKLLWMENKELVRSDGWGYEDEKKTKLSSRVLRMASSAPVVEKYAPELNATATAIEILEAINNPVEMLYINEWKDMPSGKEFMLKSICETSMTSWLLGYWKIFFLNKTVGNE